MCLKWNSSTCSYHRLPVFPGNFLKVNYVHLKGSKASILPWDLLDPAYMLFYCYYSLLRFKLTLLVLNVPLMWHRFFARR